MENSLMLQRPLGDKTLKITNRYC